MMSRILIRKIDRCFGCPYLRTPSDDKIKLDWCYLEGKLIEVNLSIKDMPDWCPLPDKTLRQALEEVYSG